ncbi:MAG TPA: hypothetical protein VH394_24420 [Thermoanaerobaculia bacterium]|nr:hypothetical protein [Thermoanaerobaculia bacterium]
MSHEIDAPGLTIVKADAGLLGWGSESRKLNVDIQGSVELALLFWAGRDRPCQQDPATGVCTIPSEPYRDQAVRLDGKDLVGNVLGTEYQPSTSRGPILNIGYGLDVTEEVRAKGSGKVSFLFADGNTASNLDEISGVSLLVLTSDATKPMARVLIFQGLDFAYGEDRTHGETEITQAVTFNHGAVRNTRKATVYLFVGDCDDLRRPDRIDITGNPSLMDTLDGSVGAKWDADVIPIHIAGGAVSTTVQIFSEPWGKNPDSLLWVAAALSLPLTASNGCPVTLWHSRTDLWSSTGLSPTQRVRNVFQPALDYGQAGDATLRTALRFQDQAGLLGAAKTLIKQGVGALLNATHGDLEFPYTRAEVINQVGETLRTHDEAQIRAFAAVLKAANEANCPLD